MHNTLSPLVRILVFVFTTAVGLTIFGTVEAIGQTPSTTPRPTATPTGTPPKAVPTGTAPAGDRPVANQPMGTTEPTTAAPPRTQPSTGPSLPPQSTPAMQQPPTTTTVDSETPEPDGKVPKAATVIETKPTTTPANAPPDGKPVLSAPVPPAETIPLQPKVRYFMLVFGAESVPKRGRWTHTWMTIVKATPREGLTGYTLEGEQAKYYDLLAHTISWMPAQLRIRVIKFRPECGVNLDLETSIRYCLGMCERVALWGPFEVNPLVAEEVYAATRKQIALLESGRVLYKSLDFEGSAAAWCKNCIHAVSDMDGIGRRLTYNEIQHNGWEGSRVIVRYMARANRIEPQVRHEWVAEALGINKYCISRQQIPYCKPAVPVTAATPAAAPVQAAGR
jgi:hypothetical protein